MRINLPISPRLQAFVDLFKRALAETEHGEQPIGCHSPGHVAETDEQARFNWEAARKMGPLGLLGLNVPEEYGGAGVDAVSAAVAIEELGRVDLLQHGGETQW